MHYLVLSPDYVFNRMELNVIEEAHDKLIRIQRKENLQNDDNRVRKQEDDNEMSRNCQLEVSDFYM